MGGLLGSVIGAGWGFEIICCIVVQPQRCGAGVSTFACPRECYPTFSAPREPGLKFYQAGRTCAW